MKLKLFLTNLLMTVLLMAGTILPAAAADTDLYPLQYRAHVEDIGWQDYVDSPNEAGTTGKAKAMEAFEIKSDPVDNINFTIQAHVSDIGWMDPVTDQVAGTTGKAKNLEAVKISLMGENADKYKLNYQAHVANVGWMDWVESGQEAGTTGKAQAIEAIRIKLVPVVSPTDDASDFVSLHEVAPEIMQEVRYYTTYNFVGDRIDGYEEPTILMTKEAAAALKAVNDDLLANHDYILKVYDAYRPQMAVDHFVRWAKDLDDVRMKPYFYPEVDKSRLFEEDYIAEKSGHTRGSTVDLTIFDRKTGKELDMGGTFDYFGELSHPSYTNITEEQYNNRMLLRSTMEKYNFHGISSEWWHFTLNDEPFKDTYFTFPVNDSVVSK